MLSKRAYFFMKIFVPFTASLGITPFTWNSYENLLARHHKKPFPKYLYRLNFVLVSLWLNSCGIIQCIRYHYFHKNYDNFNISLIFTLVGFLQFEIWLIYTFLEDETIIGFNALLIYLRRIQSKNISFKLISITFS